MNRRLRRGVRSGTVLRTSAIMPSLTLAVARVCIKECDMCVSETSVYVNFNTGKPDGFFAVFCEWRWVIVPLTFKPEEELT